MATDKQGESEDLPWQPLVVDHGFYSPLVSGSIDGTDKIPHDKAIQRALKSTYKPNNEIKGNPENTIFVARLSHQTTQDVLQNAFSKYGEISNCSLVKDIVTGRSMGYAFIEFKDSRDAEDAYEECHNMFLDGSQLIVDYECERLLPGWLPRRFGGGLGGKKESGQLRFGGRDRPFRRPIVLGRPSAGHSYHGNQREDRHRQSRRPSPRQHREESRRRCSRSSRHHRSRSRSRQRY